MATAPGDKFEPPYVGSYNHGFHGEGRVRGTHAVYPKHSRIKNTRPYRSFVR